MSWRHEEGEGIEVIDVTLLTLPLFLAAKGRINIHWGNYSVPGTTADGLHMESHLILTTLRKRAYLSYLIDEKNKSSKLICQGSHGQKCLPPIHLWPTYL